MVLLTTRKAAEKLGFSTRYVCELAKTNKLQPFAVLDNGHNVFTSQSIEDFKAKKKAEKEVKDAK
jgi:hypothetical protein